MIETGQSLTEMALTTAAIGMGVVIVTLFLLSVYMHYFKILLAKVEQRHAGAPAAAAKQAAAPSPALGPAPDAPVRVGTEDDRVAAAIAVGLHLEQGGAAPSAEVAAAIATALACHRSRLRTGLQRAPGSQAWTLSGRVEAMSARVRRQER